jgi:CRP-like cAMP-binding protein
MPDGVRKVHATIDGRAVEVDDGTTIFDAARRLGIDVPTICHMPPQEPAGVCRVCVVELKPPPLAPGAKPPPPKLVPACAQLLADQMDVVTTNDRLATVRRTLVELLMADHPTPCARQRDTRDCELEQRAEELGADATRYARAAVEPLPVAGWTPNDDSHPNILVDHAACIVCDRCVRACSDIAQNFVIGRAGKGNATVITFDDGHRMGESSCVSCGECLASCPTGALMNRGFAGAEMAGTAVTAERLLAIRGPDGTTPLFDGISHKFLTKVLGDVGIGRNEHAVVERRVKKGEIICREGDNGSTAFYVERGRVEVSVATPGTLRSVPGGLRGLARAMRSFLSSDDEDAAAAGSRRTIPIDGPIDLDRRKPIAERGPGDLFGEMTCLDFYPRSATVRALEDTVVVEMLRPVLQILRRSRSFRAHLDRVYRERSLEEHLRTIPLLADVSPDFVDRLRGAVELVRYEPGQVVYEQGSVADAFYLVRIGFVKVTQKLAGGDLVRAYRGRGDFFGEIGLLFGLPRTATCSAADHVEVVRIGADVFRALLERFPDVARRLHDEAKKRLATYEPDAAMQAGGMDIEELMRQGLMEAQSLLVLDLDRCTRCDLCVQACATAHDGVTRLVREGLRYDHYLVATSCRQCRDPLCMVGCPVGSIRRRENLEIHIESWCIGCGVCADNCPYGNINMHPVPDRGTRRAEAKKAGRRKAAACDLCHNLAENQDPSCVVACPHGAAIRVANPTEFFAKRLTSL